MNLTYRYRLLTRKRDHVRLNELVEQQRQLYNAALEERIGCYRATRKSLSFYDQNKSLTECRRELPGLADVPVALQRGTLLRLHRAFEAFFRRLKRGQKPGFPRFRGRGRFDTLEWTEFKGVTFDGGRIRSKAFGAIRVHLHRPMPEGSNIRAVRIVRDTKGWHVCFQVRLDAPPKVSVSTLVGLDVGLTHLATLSTGEQIPSLRAARRAQRRLRIEQRHLSRCSKGSGGRRKARKRVARVHAKVRNRRRTYAHQVSADLVRRFDLIAAEDLNVKGLAMSMLAKSVNDAGWSTLLDMIAYKAERAGRHFVKVDPRHTTSDCSQCGHRTPKLLSERVHFCSSCGLRLDRDQNAAINILNRGVVVPGVLNVAGYGVRAPGKLSYVN